MPADALEREVAGLTRTWNDDLVAELVRVHGPVEDAGWPRSTPAGSRPGTRRRRRWPRRCSTSTSWSELPRDRGDVLFHAAAPRQAEPRPPALRAVPDGRRRRAVAIRARAGEPRPDRGGGYPYRLETADDDGGRTCCTSTTSVCAPRVPPSTSRPTRSVWRGLRPPSSKAKRPRTASTGWSCAPAWSGKTSWCCAPTAATAARSATTFSQSYLDEALVSHPDVARALVELFDAKFDPRRDADEKVERARARWWPVVTRWSAWTPTGSCAVTSA